MHAFMQVAFMFLTRGVMYHEAIWDLWFRSAAGLLPVAALSAANCEPGLLEHLGHSCGASAGGGALQQQHLFSVFVHVGANEEAFSGVPAFTWNCRCTICCTAMQARRGADWHLHYSGSWDHDHMDVGI